VTPHRQTPRARQVKFDIDANGILSVTATDKGTGKKQDIKITGASVLPKVRARCGCCVRRALARGGVPGLRRGWRAAAGAAVRP
jgi:hypothetical protein